MTSRRYGPHRDEDTPVTVRVRPRRKYGPEIEVALPPALARQRRQINDAAWWRSRP